MKVKITPIAESSQIIEFNINVPCGANTAVAPVSTLTINQRWAKVIDVSTTSTPSYVQITKLDIIHNLQYTDCSGKVKVATDITSTILATPATSTTISTLDVLANKAVDIIIPPSITYANQETIDNSPTSIPSKGHCAYSVFEIHVEETTPPAQNA
jgi:hypothetical protein